MSAPTAMNYLNPLTLEAQIFLNSLKSLGKPPNVVDVQLCTTLKHVVDAITSFIDLNTDVILPTTNTTLVAPEQVNQIKRLYYCDMCRMDLGKTPTQAAVHLMNGHKNSATSKKPATQSASKEGGKQKDISERKKVRREKRLLVVAQRETADKKLPKKIKSIIVCDWSKFFADNVVIAEKLKQIPQYNLIESDLLQLTTKLFPGEPVAVYKFGSRMTGVGSRNSDLDIFVDIGNVSNNFENRASAKTLKNLEAVHKAIKEDKKKWISLRAIEGARVPILRVRHLTTNIECDIGFSNSLGFYNTKMIEYFFNLQPIARRMTIFIKKWLERSKMSDGLPTYNFLLMVVFFLQLKNYLPSIMQLQADDKDVARVGPWIASFEEKSLSAMGMQKLEMNTEQCKIFLKAFFEFYASFDYAKNVVCPYSGRTTAKTAIEAEMPERYTKWVSENAAEKAHKLQLDRPVVVQDPLQLNHNVGKRISKYQLMLLTEYFKQSAALITQNM